MVQPDCAKNAAHDLKRWLTQIEELTRKRRDHFRLSLPVGLLAGAGTYSIFGCTLRCGSLKYLDQ
jgi:hypothetical protein